MQTATKLSNKDIVKSLFTFIFGTIGIYVIIILMILINEGGSGFGNYFVQNQQPLLTIAVSIAVLSAMLYCYFIFENKFVLSRLTKMSEIYKTIIVNRNRMSILLTKEGMNNERKREPECVRN